MPAAEPSFKISSYCHSGGCVAVALAPQRALVCCSRETDGQVLSFDSARWNGFLAGLGRVPGSSGGS